MTSIKTIATIHCDFTTKFGVPRQSNLIQELESTIIFEPEYRNPEAVRGLEDFSHIWLLWGFSMAEREEWSPTVRPPRLGGNKRMGVFATRSPFRPNPVGLSSVRLVSVQNHDKLGPILHILGADLMDKTPIFDIKPYLPFVDSHPDASCGFAQVPPGPVLQVHIPDVFLHMLPKSKQQALTATLSHDPRPQYQDDPERIYRMQFAGFDVAFTVTGNSLYVVSITAL